jgi:hypothetical protein
MDRDNHLLSSFTLIQLGPTLFQIELSYKSDLELLEKEDGGGVRLKRA